MAMNDQASKSDIVTVLLKQLEASSALFNLIEVDRTDVTALAKARTAYFSAQQDLLSIAKEFLND